MSMTGEDIKAIRDLGCITPELKTLYFNFESASQYQKIGVHAAYRKQFLVASEAGAVEL